MMEEIQSPNTGILCLHHHSYATSTAPEVYRRRSSMAEIEIGLKAHSNPSLIQVKVIFDVLTK